MEKIRDSIRINPVTTRFLIFRFFIE